MAKRNLLASSISKWMWRQARDLLAGRGNRVLVLKFVSDLKKQTGGGYQREHEFWHKATMPTMVAILYMYDHTT